MLNPWLIIEWAVWHIKDIHEQQEFLIHCMMNDSVRTKEEYPEFMRWHDAQ